MKPVAILALATAVFGATSAQAATKPGTFAGTLGISVPKGGQGEVRAISRADGRVVKTKTLGRTGAFSLTLPAGGYLVVGSVIPPKGKLLAQTQVAVSLKAGQKRTKTSLKARKKKKPKAKKRKSARASFVQELGQVTPGRVAVEIPSFTGATGELSVMNKGMAHMLITDMFGAGGAADECDVAVLEVEHRDDILKELELQKSPYFDQSTRVERNFIKGDVEVRGTLKNGAGGKTLEYDVQLIDKQSGNEVGRLKGTMDASDVFAGEQELAKKLNEELCKLSDVYEVTLNVTGAANFATHSAGGTLNAVVQAKRATKKSPIWRGSGSLGWTGTSFSTKISECSYINPVEPTIPWNVTITNLGNGDMLVEWQPDGSDPRHRHRVLPDRGRRRRHGARPAGTVAAAERTDTVPASGRRRCAAAQRRLQQRRRRLVQLRHDHGAAEGRREDGLAQGRHISHIGGPPPGMWCSARTSKPWRSYSGTLRSLELSR